MKLKLIACDIARTEFDWAMKQSPHSFDVEYLPQGYHNDVETGRRAIQESINAADAGGYERIILGYALCNNMLAGIRASAVPMIVARAHDCITWFLGSKERYREEFDNSPGTYYYTEGWLGVRDGGQQAAQPEPEERESSGVGISGTWEEMVAKYGEDNAKFLWEMSTAWTKHYHYGTYIDLPCANREACLVKVDAICRRNGWERKELPGDIGLFQRWVDGPWSSEEFLAVPAGAHMIPTFDNQILTIGATRKA